MSSSKCDADGNLYIRKYSASLPLLGPVVKIDPDGKRTAVFDPTAFSNLKLDRADAFSPAEGGGLYQVAQMGVLKPHVYILHFSSDGSPSSTATIDADFEVYTFAAFAGGNVLVSGVRRDTQDKNDRGHTITAVFSSDGRELTQLSFQNPPAAAKKAGSAAPDSPAPTLDLAYAEVGSDGNLYVARGASPTQVFVITPSGKILHSLKVASPLPGAMPSAFHVSGNRMALSFWDDKSERLTVVVAEAQTGRRVATYPGATGLGPSFACYSANDGVFTFLKLGEGNSLQVIRAEAQ